MNRPLFAGDPEVRILGYGKEQIRHSPSGLPSGAMIT